MLPKLKICNNEIKQSESIKFLGVFLDENLSWKEHIKYTENKIAKNTGLLFRAKPYLNKRCLLSLYYSYIHTYISYANIAWGSTYVSNLKKINSQQKHAIRIIYNKNKYESVQELLRSLKILNVYQINILNNIILMHHVSTKTAPIAFLTEFTKPTHWYHTRFSNFSYVRPTYKLHKSKYRISIRGPYLWNDFLSQTEKAMEKISCFKTAIKKKLLSTYNELSYF